MQKGEILKNEIGFYFIFFFLCCAPTFVFQSESGCRDTDIGEEVEVELVGGAVEQCRDGGALGRGLSSRNVIQNKRFFFKLRSSTTPTITLDQDKTQKVTTCADISR